MRKNTYKRDRRRTAILYACGIVAIGSCLALIVFFVHTLLLRTQYRATCLEINDAILASSAEQNTIQRGDEVYPMPDYVLEYYNILLLEEDTLVRDRSSLPPTAKSIILHISDNSLTFTPVPDDAYAFNLC